MTAGPPFLLLAALGAALSGCTRWPQNGAGGMAEHAPAPPPSASLPDSQARRLACALERVVALRAASYQVGLLEGRVNLIELTAARARRESEGGLPADAAITLARLQAETALTAAQLPVPLTPPPPECP